MAAGMRRVRRGLRRAARVSLFLGRAALLPVLLALSFAGLMLRGVAGVLFALVAAGVAALVVRLRSGGVSLRPGWRVAEPRRDPDLIADVAMLSARAGIVTPRIEIAASAEVFAYVADRRRGRSIIAVSDSLLALLSREECCGVLAHEVAHLTERDTRLTRFAASLARLVGTLTFRDLEKAPPAATFLASGVGLAQLFVSRRREFEADRRGAALCGNPLWLASALQRLHESGVAARLPQSALVRNLLSTHPHPAKRIAALLELAGVVQAFASDAMSVRPAARRWRPFAGTPARMQSSFLGGYGLHQPFSGGSWR